MKEKTQKIEEEICFLANQQNNLAKIDYDKSNNSYSNARIIVIGTIILAILIGIGVGLYISGLISKPLVILNIAVRKVSEGDLTLIIQPVENQDEIGELAKSFDKELAGLAENLIASVNNFKL